MNIFVLDKDQKKSAKYHADCHITKMVVESAQLLSSVHWMAGNTAPYRLTHKNHPCSKWARESKENYDWLIIHTEELCKEYTRRYKKIHKSQYALDEIKSTPIDIPSIGLTEFPLAMPDDVKTPGDPVKSYRDYYMKYKKDIAKWNHSKKPKWYNI